MMNASLEESVPAAAGFGMNQTGKVVAKMRKRVLGIAIGALLALGALGMAGCSGSAEQEQGGDEAASPTGTVSVYSREDGSGTRSAFIELFGIEQKDAGGQKVDMTTPSAAITNSTSVMMTSVAGDDNGIGYISLGSLNDTVKALEINGVKASAGNVKNGSYEISRPFNIVTKDGLSDAARDFVGFIMSDDGQKVVEDNGYIAVADNAEAYAAAGLSGKIVIAGSSSVTPVMEKLAEAYEALNPEVSIEVNQSDSTTGVQMAAEGTCDIGMASRDLKDSESAVTATAIAQDGIAVIVSKACAVNGLSSDQVEGIYTGALVTWEDVLA